MRVEKLSRQLGSEEREFGTERWIRGRLNDQTLYRKNHRVFADQFRSIAGYEWWVNGIEIHSERLY